jgi:flagellin-specific chaperone FliS
MRTIHPGAAYLENQVLTASPARLRLMLIEAGLRFAQKTIDDWSAGHDEAACDSLRRCRAFVAELLAGIDP